MKKIFLFAVMLLATTAMYAVDIANEIPTGWTYISNNPDQYPDPSFYKDGGIKMNFPGIGIQSPEFDAAAEATINFSVKLNKNQKNNDGNDAKAFTAYGLDANGDVVAEEGLDVAAAGDFSITVAGEGIVAVKLIMTAYPTDGESFYNADLLAVEIDGEGGGQGGQGGNEEDNEIVPDYAELVWAAEYGQYLLYLSEYDAEEGIETIVNIWINGTEEEFPTKAELADIDTYYSYVALTDGTDTTYYLLSETEPFSLTINYGEKYETEENGYKLYLQSATISMNAVDEDGNVFVIKSVDVDILYDYEESGATGVENIENATGLDLNAPMFNVLGQKVDAQFRGVVIQNGKKYILR
ncbi:MAG: hypothetical protein IJ756_00635 [Paludibacteraceae bacterium]|nr:hypothetical protein [Paludibacteraceae bacterium]